MAIVLSFPPRLSVLPRLTTSDYPFGILWPLYFLSFLDLRLLITPLVSCGHCIVCHSLILYCPSFLDLRLLITPLVSCGHCAVCPSSIYDLWLSFSYLVAIVLSVLPRFTTSDYSFGIMWPFYCLSFLELRLLITLLVSCGHCIVCPSSINDFWLPLWYHVVIVLSVLPRFTISDYPFGVLWPLYCLSFLDLRLLITSLVSCGHCIVCHSSIYDFWLLLWYLVAIVLSVLLRFTTFDYPFGILWPLDCLSFFDFVFSVIPRFTTYDYPFRILWPLYCLSFLDLRLLITPLVSCGGCIVCPSSINDFWWPLWYLVAIVLSVLPRFTTSDYPFWYLVAIVLSVLPRFTISDYPVGVLWPLYYLSLLDFRLLITPLVSCGHYIVCPSSISDFWLPLWYLVAIVLSVLPRFTTSGYPFGILWPVYCLSFLDLRVLITLMVSCGHCIVCPSSINDFWLPLWYHVVILLSVLPRFTISDYLFGVLWPLYCLSLLDLRLLITPLVSFGHCIVCPSSIYDFWLPLWYLVAIVLSVLPQFTTSDYPFGIMWPLYCLSFLILRFLITPLVSCGLYIIFPSSISDFWLPLWYLVAIVLSVLPRFTTYDYFFGILWPLYFLSFLDLRFLITPLVSCGHCIVCPSSIYDFWLLLWYLVAIVLSVLPRFTTFDYPFGILWPLYCLSVLDLRLLIIPFVSCGHCIVFPSSIVCPSSINDFWLPLWYLVAIVFSVLPRFTTSDYPFGILWPLYCLSFLDFVLSVIPRFTTSDYPFGILWPLRCLSFLDLRLMIILFVSCGHCIVCPSSIYDFWLLLWYHLAILLSVLPRVTTSDYPFGILWPLYCLSFLD